MSETIPSRPAEKLWDRLADPEYRRGFMAARVGGGLAAQIFALRSARNLTQKALAAKVGTTQPQVSAWESTCENISLNSLLKFAEAFDVGLTVRFAPFSEVAVEASSATLGRNIPSFEGDSPHRRSTIHLNAQIAGGKITTIGTEQGNYSRRNSGVSSWPTRNRTLSEPIMPTVQASQWPITISV